MRFVWCIWSVFVRIVSSEGVAYAQSGTAGWTDVSEGASNAAAGVLDEDLFPSVRGAGMSRALETTADDLDAAIFNPAGIGGLHPAKGTVPFLRRLYFPWTSLSVNRNTVHLYREFGTTGAAGSSAIGRAIINAQAGKRQYARATLTSGIVFGRVMVVPIHDYQVAAASQGEGSGLVAAHYRGMAGLGAGTSVQSSDGRLALGYFGYQVDRKEIEGTFDYGAFIDADVLQSAIKPYTRTLRGTGHSLGVMWRPSVPGHAALGLSLKDAGNTRFRDLGVGEPLIVKQNLAMGVSVTPQLARESATLLLSLGADRLNDLSVPASKKAHAGLELSLGGLGNYAVFNLRGGVSHGGGSIGVGAHFGLIGFHLALQNLDIGAGSKKVIEQRMSFNLYVNVAEF